MHLIYRRLVNIRIRHDYYLESLDNAGVTSWPKDYNVDRFLEIIPAPECLVLLRNYKLIFKQTPTGFSVYVAVNPDQPTRSLVYIDPTIKLRFIVRLKDPYFMNFTNLPLISNGNNVFYFQNLTANVLNTTLFLSRLMLPFSSPPAHQFGDLIIHNNKVLEAIKKDPDDPTPNSTRIDCSIPVVPAAGASWCESTVSDARYVTSQDIIAQQGNTFEYRSTNDAPGLPVTFSLLDINGQPVSLGNITNTDSPQNTYIAPIDPAALCNYRLDLSGIPPGVYTLKIVKGGIPDPRRFYLTEKLRTPDIFGVMELFAQTTAAGYQFLNHIPAAFGKASEIQEKTFEIRFKNRVTRREYIKQDGIALTEKPVAGFSLRYKEFKIASESMPDPNPALIYAKRISNDPSNVNYDKLEDISSKIYLNQ